MIIVGNDEHPRFQTPLQGAGRIDAEDLPHPQFLQGLQVGLVVDEVRQDVAVGVRPVTGDEDDLGGAEDERRAELRFHRLFPQIRKNPLSLQKDGSRDDAQGFHSLSLQGSRSMR